MIELRPARSRDYDFAHSLYVQTIKPYASAWAPWIDEQKEAGFAALWRPEDTSIIRCDDEEVGWVEVREAADEVFLKQFYVAPAYQRQGIGSRVLRRLIEEWQGTGRSMALFVLKNNPAVRFYERFGFRIMGRVGDRFVMRRAPTGRGRSRAPAFVSGGLSRSDQ